MTVVTSCQFWQDTVTRLHLAWRVLTGRAVMYRVKLRGPVTLAVDCGVAVTECEFRLGTKTEWLQAGLSIVREFSTTLYGEPARIVKWSDGTYSIVALGTDNE